MSKDKGYVFVELEVHDMDNFKAHYQPRSTAAVAAFNGRLSCAVVKSRSNQGLTMRVDAYC